MRGFALGLSLSVAFIIGCVSRPFIVPPARAQQGAVQRWEYLCLNVFDHEDVQAEANRAGREGWEMVAVDGFSRSQSWCFKRPL